MVITDIADPSHHDLAWNAGDPPDGVNQDQNPDPSSVARQRNTPCIQRGIDRHQNADSISGRRRQCRLPVHAFCNHGMNDVGGHRRQRRAGPRKVRRITNWAHHHTGYLATARLRLRGLGECLVEGEVHCPIVLAIPPSHNAIATRTTSLAIREHDPGLRSAVSFGGRIPRTMLRPDDAQGRTVTSI